MARGDRTAWIGDHGPPTADAGWQLYPPSVGRLRLALVRAGRSTWTRRRGTRLAEAEGPIGPVHSEVRGVEHPSSP